MDQIERTTSILRSGGVAIFPTDTAFGIGCRVDDANAVQRIFAIKKRSLNKPTPILVSGITMAEQWVDHVSEDVTELMNKYWPGGLTIILQTSNKSISPMVTAGTGTVGLRVPDNEDLRKIIDAVGVPIIGSSANFEGQPTPYAVEDLDKKLTRLVDVVLDGKCTVKKASTVVDCTKVPFIVIREGAVQLEKL
jgi:L-threonylcarbamoyladenylate synthase